MQDCYHFKAHLLRDTQKGLGRISPFLQATKALRVSRGTALLFARNSALQMVGGGSAPRLGRLYPWERPGAHCTGGWVVPRREKSCPHRDSIPDRPASSSVAIPTELSGTNRFNIQQLYTLPTLYLCVLYLSENKQRLVPLTA